MQVPFWARAAALMLSCAVMAAPAQAGVISYNFTAVVNANGILDPLAGTGIAAGTIVTASMRVNDATLPDSGTITPHYAFYDQAVIGGTISAAGMSWTFGGTQDNYAVVWNDEDVGGGQLFDGLWVTAPLNGGPSLNGLAPAYAGFVLFSHAPGSNDALGSLALPTALDLADFTFHQGGNLAFGGPGNWGAASLDITSFSITREAEVPEPGTLALLLAGGLGGWAALRRRPA